MLFRFSSLLLALGLTVKYVVSSDDVEYPQLGVNSLEALSYDYDVTVDENCDYHFSVSFSHNDDFPVGSMDTCVPSAVVVSDGLPMLQGRYFWEGYPAYVEEATEINHLSLDYNACGHPTGGFLSPHYDFHFYRVTPQYRAEEMVCDLIPQTPVCYAEQTTASGKAFFELEVATGVSISSNDTEPILTNVPLGFSSHAADAVINMGMHVFDRSIVPTNPADWIEPSLIFVTYDSQVICFEPMLPFIYVAGDEDLLYSEPDIQYVEKSIETLPYGYEVSYDASVKVTTLSFSGKSKVCQADFEAAKAAYEESMMMDEGGDTSPEDEGGDTSPEEDVVASSFCLRASVATIMAGLVATIMA